MTCKIASFLKECSAVSQKLEAASAASGLFDATAQPKILSESCTLSNHQLAGLNWLLLLNSTNVNGILADEMGLGKTVQIIALLAHLKEKGLCCPGKPHLIVVPSSTLDNWKNEFAKWCPPIALAIYHGTAAERKSLRIGWARSNFENVEVILTTYSTTNSCPEERKMFKVVAFHYAVFDEAHMLKNMQTQRYVELTQVKASNRVLLTGTPLQNNLLELVSLLVFLMPSLFKNVPALQDVFFKAKTQIAFASKIMKPFVLRRLKSDVIKSLPQKSVSIVPCKMTSVQQVMYEDLTKQIQKESQDGNSASSMAAHMRLRCLANHPLLIRYHFQDSDLEDIVNILGSENIDLSDLKALSDFELHKLCVRYKSCNHLSLPAKLIGQSGKLRQLDELLPKLREDGHRVLIFSQFLTVLDVLQEHFHKKSYKILRLDGSTPVSSRQEHIEEYNHDTSIFIFLLSTRACGVGINLASADTVIVHDLDLNPHNDLQAEDRCHRIGQTKPVTVYYLISLNTVEENIFSVAQEKLKLEKGVSRCIKM